MVISFRTTFGGKFRISFIPISTPDRCLHFQSMYHEHLPQRFAHIIVREFNNEIHIAQE